MNPADPTATHAPNQPADSSESDWDAGLAAAFGLPQKQQQPPPAEPEVGVILAGKYRLTERIGEGGMGSVWVAQQTEPVKRKVAIKLIKAGMDSKSVLARFEAERQALAMMDHPNIAKVLDGGLHDGRPFFVMELVKGVPITEYCDARKLTPRERLDLFLPVCHAIQHAHQKGIIHRDIKPSNVLIALYDDRPVPKVIDFGVAKSTGGTLTEQTIETAFGGVIGTPQYMSPEQATLNNLDIDTRSDVYSLGVLLYELLTGSPPFARRDLEQHGLLEMLRVVREVEPPKPSTKLSTAAALPTLAINRGTEPGKLTKLLRSELDWIVLRALEKDRARRYETANGFAADINRYLAGEPVVAHPPTLGYRLRKTYRKNRAAILTAAAFALLLVAGTVVSAWQAVRATTAERQAWADRVAADEQRQLAERREAQAKENEQKARAAEAAAKESDATAQAVLKFVGAEVFGAPNPRVQNAPGRDVTLRQALDAAEPKIATAFAGRPRVEAELRNILGVTYGALGEQRPPVPQFERALALALANFPDDPVTRQIELNLSTAYSNLGRREEAIKLLERSLARQRKTRGPDHPDTIPTLLALMVSHRDSGRSADARRLAQDLLRLDWGGKPEDLQPGDLSKLSHAYTVAGRADEGLRLLEQALPRFREKRGSDDLDVLNITQFIAHAHWEAGRREDSIRLLEPAYRQAVGKYGQASPVTSQLLWFLSPRLGQAGRYADMARLLEEALPELRKRYGPANPSISPHVINLSEAYSKLGRHRDTLRLLEATIAGIPEADRPGYTNYDFLLANLVEAYSNLGEAAQARRVTADLEAWLRRRHPANSLQLARALDWWGGNFTEVRLSEVAEPFVRESLAIREAKAPDAWERFNSAALLGGALLDQKKYADAEPLLLAGYEGMRQREKMIPPQGKVRIPEALDRLIEFYTATSKPDEMKKWQAERAKYPVMAPQPRDKK